MLRILQFIDDIQKLRCINVPSQGNERNPTKSLLSMGSFYHSKYSNLHFQTQEKRYWECQESREIILRSRYISCKFWNESIFFLWNEPKNKKLTDDLPNGIFITPENFTAIDEEECRVPFSPETFAFDQRLVLKPTTKFEKCQWTSAPVKTEFFKEIENRFFNEWKTLTKDNFEVKQNNFFFF